MRLLKTRGDVREKEGRERRDDIRREETCGGKEVGREAKLKNGKVKR